MSLHLRKEIDVNGVPSVVLIGEPPTIAVFDQELLALADETWLEVSGVDVDGKFTQIHLTLTNCTLIYKVYARYPDGSVTCSLQVRNGKKLHQS